MNKQEIFDAFDQKISKTAIVEQDGVFRIVGKDIEIEPIDNGMWDIWVHNRKDLQKGVGTGRVNNILARLGLATEPWTRLNGEAHTCAPLEVVKPALLDNLAYLGIRRKRVVTPEQKQAFLDNIRGSL